MTGTGSGPPEVQIATRADAAAMTATLAAAFVDDPPLCWVLSEPDPARRERRLAAFFEPMVRGAIAKGLALHTPGCEAVTLWRLPGAIHPAFFETTRALPQLRRALGEGGARARLIGDTLKEKEPGFDYWYLQFLGVSPDAQGKGLGGWLVREGLERARRAGFPAYLEAAKPENVELYRHLGFRVVDEWDIPDGGPHFWGMLHE